MRVNDTISIMCRVMKGLGLEFFLSEDIPLPGEIKTALDFIAPTPYPCRWNSGPTN